MTGLTRIAIRNGRSLTSQHSLTRAAPILIKLGTSVRYYYHGGRGTTRKLKDGRPKTWQEKAFKPKDSDEDGTPQPSIFGRIQPTVEEDGTIFYKAAPPLASSTAIRDRQSLKEKLKGIRVDTTIPTDLIDLVADATFRRGKDRLTKRGSPESIINMTKNERALRQMLVRYAKTLPLKTGGYPNVYVVGGWVRDKVLGAETLNPRVNIVVEGMEATQFAASLTEYIRNYGNSLGKANMGVEFTGFNGVRIRKVNPETGMLVARKKGIEADETEAKQLNSAEAILYGIYVEMRSLRTTRKKYEKATIGEDARFRDATVNALYYSLNWKSLHDPTKKGLDDLYNKILRPPIDAKRCFENDPVRALRYIRLAAQHDFTIAPEALEVLKSDWIGNALRDAPREYVNAELDKLFKSNDSVVKAVDMIHSLNLYNSIFDLELTPKEKSGDWDYPDEAPQTNQITPPNYSAYPTAIKIAQLLLDFYHPVLSDSLKPLLHLHSPLLFKLALLYPYSHSGLYACKTNNETRTDVPFFNHALVRAHRIGLRSDYTEESLVRCAVRDYTEILATANLLSTDPSAVSIPEAQALFEKWTISTGTYRYGSVALSISYALLTALTDLTFAERKAPKALEAPEAPETSEASEASEGFKGSGTPFIAIDDTPAKLTLLRGFEALVKLLSNLDASLPTTLTPLWRTLEEREIAAAGATMPIPYQQKTAPPSVFETFVYPKPEATGPEDEDEKRDYMLRKKGQLMNQQMKHFGPKKVPTIRFIPQDGPGKDLAVREGDVDPQDPRSGVASREQEWLQEQGRKRGLTPSGRPIWDVENGDEASFFDEIGGEQEKDLQGEDSEKHGRHGWSGGPLSEVEQMLNEAREGGETEADGTEEKLMKRETTKDDVRKPDGEVTGKPTWAPPRISR